MYSSFYDYGFSNFGANFYLLVIIFFLLYFFPTIVALVRSHKNLYSLFVLNFFLGISFIGWVVALMWAFWEYDENLTEKK